MIPCRAGYRSSPSTLEEVSPSAPEISVLVHTATSPVLKQFPLKCHQTWSTAMQIPVSKMERQRCSASSRSGIWKLEGIRAISNSTSELQALQPHLSIDTCKGVSFDIFRSKIHPSANGLCPCDVQPDHPFLSDEGLSVNICLCVLCFWNYHRMLFSVISNHHLLSGVSPEGLAGVLPPCHVPRSRKTFFKLKVLQVTPPSFPSSSLHLFHAASQMEDSEEAQEPWSSWWEKSLGAWRPLATLVLLNKSFEPELF